MTYFQCLYNWDGMQKIKRQQYFIVYDNKGKLILAISSIEHLTPRLSSNCLNLIVHNLKYIYVHEYSNIYRPF